VHKITTIIGFIIGHSQVLRGVFPPFFLPMLPMGVLGIFAFFGLIRFAAISTPYFYSQQKILSQLFPKHTVLARLTHARNVEFATGQVIPKLLIGMNCFIARGTVA
jgi:hypothetical protein